MLTYGCLDLLIIVALKATKKWVGIRCQEKKTEKNLFCPDY